MPLGVPAHCLKRPRLTQFSVPLLPRPQLAKKGGRIKITDCGGRLCIVASKNQTGTFSEWHGLWNDAKTGQPMVIPNGY